MITTRHAAMLLLGGIVGAQASSLGAHGSGRLLGLHASGGAGSGLSRADSLSSTTEGWGAREQNRALRRRRLPSVRRRLGHVVRDYFDNIEDGALDGSGIEVVFDDGLLNRLKRKFPELGSKENVSGWYVFRDNISSEDDLTGVNDLCGGKGFPTKLIRKGHDVRRYSDSNADKHYSLITNGTSYLIYHDSNGLVDRYICQAKPSMRRSNTLQVPESHESGSGSADPTDLLAHPGSRWNIKIRECFHPSMTWYPTNPNIADEEVIPTDLKRREFLANESANNDEFMKAFDECIKDLEGVRSGKTEPTTFDKIREDFLALKTNYKVSLVPGDFARLMELHKDRHAQDNILGDAKTSNNGFIYEVTSPDERHTHYLLGTVHDIPDFYRKYLDTPVKNLIKNQGIKRVFFESSIKDLQDTLWGETFEKAMYDSLMDATRANECGVERMNLIQFDKLETEENQEEHIYPYVDRYFSELDDAKRNWWVQCPRPRELRRSRANAESADIDPITSVYRCGDDTMFGILNLSDKRFGELFSPNGITETGLRTGYWWNGWPGKCTLCHGKGEYYGIACQRCYSQSLISYLTEDRGDRDASPAKVPTTLVTVGAAHLVGFMGLPAILDRNGWTVKRYANFDGLGNSWPQVPDHKMEVPRDWICPDNDFCNLYSRGIHKPEWGCCTACENVLDLAGKSSGRTMRH